MTRTRTRRDSPFKPESHRNSIWTDFPDRIEVGEFVRTPSKMEDKGRVEDIRIYIAKNLVEFVPPLTASERDRVNPPRRTTKR
jgi:hypothetical protein